MFRQLFFGLLRTFNEWFVFPGRTRSLTRSLQPYLKNERSILDVGCSDGRVGAQLALATGAVVQGCDVHLQPTCAIPVSVYDGRTLPFDNATFDAVMIVDVLHHDLEPAQIVSEALRVSRRSVVIKDHYWENLWQRRSLRFFDWLSNAPFGISVPYNFLQPEQWDQMFRDLGATVVTERRFRLFLLDPCTQVIFVIERKLSTDTRPTPV